MLVVTSIVHQPACACTNLTLSFLSEKRVCPLLCTPLGLPWKCRCLSEMWFWDSGDKLSSLRFKPLWSCKVVVTIFSLWTCASLTLSAAPTAAAGSGLSVGAAVSTADRCQGQPGIFFFLTSWCCFIQTCPSPGCGDRDTACVIMLIGTERHSVCAVRSSWWSSYASVFAALNPFKVFFWKKKK